MFAIHSWRRSYTFVVIATVLIVAAADFLFYGHTIGWTAAAIVGAMFSLICARDTRFFNSIAGRTFTLAIGGLLVALVDQPTTLNVTYALLCLSGISLINAFGLESGFVRWARRWLNWITWGWARILLDNSVAMRWLARRGVSPKVARTFLAWTIPLALS